jgi:hypothetical protein
MEEKKVYKEVVGVQLVNDANERIYYFTAYEHYCMSDIVVVETVRGLMVGEIVELNVENPPVKPTKEVVAKVDVFPWRARQDARKRMAELKVQMDSAISRKKEEALYDMFAEDDPVLADMLAEFRFLKEQL